MAKGAHLLKQNKLLKEYVFQNRQGVAKLPAVATIPALTIYDFLLCRDYNCDSTTIRLRSDYDVSRGPASNSTQAKNERVNFSS